MISLIDFLLCLSIVCSSLFVLWNNDIVISMLNLILVFFGFTCFLVKFGLVFIGFLLFILYVGAVAILFLFSIIMLGGSERVSFLNSFSIVFFFFVFSFVFGVLLSCIFSVEVFFWSSVVNILDTHQGIFVLGQSFLLFHPLGVLLGGVLLLLGLFGGIGLSRF